MKLEQKHGCPLQARFVPKHDGKTIKGAILNWITGEGSWEFGECKQLDCSWFMKLEGEDPQDHTRRIEDWGCAIAWGPHSTLQVAKDVRQGTGGIQAATESFRNEMSRQNAVVANEMRPLIENKNERS